MADREKLYDNPRSPKGPKKGDRRTIDGVEMESVGATEDVAKDDPSGPPATVRDGHFWVPVKKEVPTS